MEEEVSRRLLEWYDRSARRLPWRGNPDPYAVWVSEIMLQQTRVETVIPYFTRWMEHFPSVASLASASLHDVLRFWEGLGYYSRARNLHRAARIIVDDLQGTIPADRAALEKLPGIGKYTAGAIASMAFGKNEAALDGNIRRIIARIFDVALPARSPEGEKKMWELARQILPSWRAGDFNQALMDLGASICLPHHPTCLICPLTEVCLAYHRGVQEERPVLQEKPPIPHLTVTAAIIHRDGQVLIAHRPAAVLLGGMWEFPGGKLESGESLENCLAREIHEELGAEVKVGSKLGVFRHAYTHFKVTLHAFHCEVAGAEPYPLAAEEIQWVDPPSLKDFPMGKIDRQIARQLVGE
jgi:A/G-specific adenine glycosylase